MENTQGAVVSASTLRARLPPTDGSIFRGLAGSLKGRLADVSLATAPATATRGTTSYICNWFRPEDSRVSSQKNQDK
jgi:hypothetical protein